MSADLIVEALEDVLREAEADYKRSSGTPLQEVEFRVYSALYELRKLSAPRKELGVLFVDSGFKTYETDVNVIRYVEIAGVYRDPEGKVVDCGARVDSLVIYASRFRGNGVYEVHVYLRPINTPVLGGDASFASTVSQELTRAVREFFPTGIRRPHVFKRFANYLTSLLELAYAVKLYVKLREEKGLNPIVVVDGSLTRWFAIKRATGVDGVDVLEMFTGLSEGEVVSALEKVVGLSKTTKLTNLLRVKRLLAERGVSEGEEVFGVFNASVPSSLVQVSGENVYQALREHVKVYNRLVYQRRGVWSARSPVRVADGGIYMVDVYSKAPVVVATRSGIKVNEEAARAVNEKLESYVPTIFAYRERLHGLPPTGYMQVDLAVRVGGEKSRALDTSLVKAMSKVAESEVNKALALLLASRSTLKRYGYR